MTDPVVIPKLSDRPAGSLDYARLRQDGIDYIAALGSEFWTDFNIHDPGITLLEALCYALTDLSYRTSFPMADLLAAPPGTPAAPERQGLFTARKILTVNPWTVADFRKLLVDVPGVKNAWLLRKCGPCEMRLYARCAESRLVYEETEHPVNIRGLYDVLLEFDEEPVGDLNSGKVKQNIVFPAGARSALALLEMRLPSWHAIQQEPDKFRRFRSPASVVTGVVVRFISGNKNDDVDIPASELARALRRPLFATIDIQFQAGPAEPVEVLSLADVPLMAWFQSAADRQALTLAALKDAITDPSPGGIAARYLAVLHRADAVVQASARQLHQHRNLAEDYCSIDAVEIADVGVCFDLELRPDAEIERVLAEVYYQIGEYFAPGIRFHSLAERRAAGRTIEQIFNGPPLDNGFIDDEQLAATQLKSAVHASDVINLVSEIDGVIAVKNFVFVRYSADGVREAVFPWSLDIPARHQPRLYLEGSKILVFKNGLPLLPDRTELADTLQMIRGLNHPAALTARDMDLPVPVGDHLDLADYFPVQHSLPPTYGIAPEGLPPTAGPARRGQAKQLQGYAFFFEQLLVNYLQQLRNLPELFAIDDSVTRTYFTRWIGPDLVPGIDTTLYQGLTLAELESLIERPSEWLDRRNRFLDHLLARFAEQFSDYALMLYRFETDRAVADAELIQNKVRFLKDYPFISANRGRAFDYRDPGAVCTSDNVAGLKRRIVRILGLNPADKLFVVEHLLLRPRQQPGGSFPDGDPLLPVCLPPDCGLCGEEDPYSFRITVVLSGEGGRANGSVSFRRFAEQTIRSEAPAHLAVKVCWVSAARLAEFETVYCAWLAELARPEPDPAVLHDRLKALLAVFNNLKNVYPPATLHDCFEGSEGNEVFLGQTVI